MSDTKSGAQPGAGAQQSAAAPSPFPPIADYAFLSNCHTGALVAADGAIDWLCVPAFDSPSVFGSLLDREAGFFRLGPYGINHPSAQAYEPGTNVLVTTWKTPIGLDRGAGRADHGAVCRRGPGHPAHPATGRRRRRPHARADGRVHRGRRSRSSSFASPPSITGEHPAEWTLVDNSRHTADATGAGQAFRLQSDLPLGIEGNRVRGRHVLEKGERAYCCPILGRGLRRPAGHRRGGGSGWPPRRASGAPGSAAPGSRTIAGATRSSAPPSRSRASHTCRRARPWRRSRRRCPRRRAASATGTTATRGCATRRSRCRHCTGSISTGRPTSSCSSSPISRRTRTARCRSCTGSTVAAT